MRYRIAASPVLHDGTSRRRSDVTAAIATGSITATMMRRSAGSRGSAHRHNLAPELTASNLCRFSIWTAALSAMSINVDQNESSRPRADLARVKATSKMAHACRPRSATKTLALRRA